MHSILSHPKQTVCSISNPQQMYLMQIAVKQCVSVSNAVYKKKKTQPRSFSVLCIIFIYAANSTYYSASLI